MKHLKTFIFACFCMGTGVLFVLGLLIILHLYIDDFKRFLKPELYPEEVKKSKPQKEKTPRGKNAIFNSTTLEENR